MPKRQLFITNYKAAVQLSFLTRHRIRLLHLTLAFSAGLVAMVSGLSGSLLVYHSEIDRALNPDLWHVAAKGVRQPLDASLNTVRDAFPDERIRFINLPSKTRDNLEIWLGNTEVRRVYLNPYTGQIVGVRGEHQGLMGFLHNLHVHLSMGDAGKKAIGVFGLGFMILLGTGLALWWPKGGRWRGAFHSGWNNTGVKRYYKRHRLAGLISICFLMISTLTGVGMVFHESTDAALGIALGDPMRQKFPKLNVPWNPPALPAIQLLENAQTVFPEAVPTWIISSSSNMTPSLVRMRFPENPHPKGSTFIALHPQNGRTLFTHSFREAGLGQKISDLKYPIHIGQFWGESGRVLTVCIGVMPTILFITGHIFWRAKKSNRSTGRDNPTC